MTFTQSFLHAPDESAESNLWGETDVCLAEWQPMDNVTDPQAPEGPRARPESAGVP